MKTDLTSLKTTPGYSLTESERASMRAKLEQLTLETPLPLRAVPSPWFIYLARPMPLAFVALLLIVSTGGVSFAAGGALPGDFLYPVKVSVNERVEVALAPTTEAKAQTRVRQAEERLRETEVLAARGDLTGDVTDAAARAVADSIEDASASAEELAEDGDVAAAAGINARIASALDVHAELLDAQADNFDDESGEALRSLSLSVASTAANAQADAADDADEADATDVRVAAEAAHTRAKDQLDALTERLAKDGIPDETEAAFALELSGLSKDYDATSAMLAADDYGSAAIAYEDIGHRAYRALTLLTSAQDIANATDQEVVITLGDSGSDLTDQAPAGARAKSAAPALMSSTLSLEATTTEEVTADATATLMMEVAPMNQARSISPKLEFRLRNRSGQ